jgi:hypothetical protein
MEAHDAAQGLTECSFVFKDCVNSVNQIHIRHFSGWALDTLVRSNTHPVSDSDYGGREPTIPRRAFRVNADGSGRPHDSARCILKHKKKKTKPRHWCGMAYAVRSLFR